MNRRAGTARHRAREVAFRIAYQSDLTSDPYADVWALRREEEHLGDDQRELVDDVVRVLAQRAADVDEALRVAADRSVLRAAVAELLARPGTPARVVLDEAIEIAKRYGSEESGRFVNGVLDRVARELRPGEL
jgi:N utilization substance protein B